MTEDTGSASITARAIVGSRRVDNAAVGNNTGAAHIYVRSGGTWTLEDTITAETDSGAGDEFGYSVAISRYAAVVGSPFNDDVVVNSGSAYVFTRSGSSWSPQDKVTASDPTAGDLFGFRVDASGPDTLVVGGFGDAAYVFTRSGSDWTEQQKLVASDATPGDNVGRAVGVSGNTVVVGARFRDTLIGGEFVLNSGSAYVFRFDGANWQEQSQLVASPVIQADARFGHAVAIDGETMVVGSYLEDVDGLADAGAVYIYVRNNNNTPTDNTDDFWQQQAKLVAPDGAARIGSGQRWRFLATPW